MTQFKVEVKVEKKRVVDLFISACEGGSNYWCKELTPTSKRRDAYEAMLDGFVVVDGESGKKHTVTPKDIEKALSLFASGGSSEKYGAESWAASHFSDWMNEQDDAATADIFLQLCVFGRVIYG